MSAEVHKKMTTRQLEVFSSETVDEFDQLADEMFAPDYTLHDPGMPNFGRGPEAVKQFMHAMIKESPDVRVVVEDAVAEEDRVAIRFSVHATNPSTGKAEVSEVMCFSRFAGGKVVEEWQVGAVIPAPSRREG